MIWAVIVIASLLLALLGGAYYAYRRTFGKTKRMQDPDPLSFIRDPR